MAETARLEVTGDASLWRRWLGEIGVDDLRYQPEFARAATRLDAGEARCARFHHPEGGVIYPFLRRSIASRPGRSDLTSPYDFGGPLLEAGEERQEAVMVAFLERWRRWCLDQGVVCEFVRLDPLRFPARLAGSIGSPFERHQPHTVVELAEGPAAARSRYTASCRRNLKRGRAAGLTVRSLVGGPEAVDVFARLYRGTMLRVGAPRYYLFPRSYFEELLALPAAHLFLAFSGDRAVAGVVFLQGGRNLYYFLGASDSQAWPLRPNNVLFDAVIGWAAERGLERLHLGGGSAPLRRFKSGFSPLTVPYYVLREIYDAALYERLTADVAASIRRAVPDHFPAYRAEEYLPLGGG